MRFARDHLRLPSRACETHSHASLLSSCNRGHSMPNNIFGGRRILVVEDDWLIVADLVQELEASGAHVIGPIPTLELALKKVDAMPDMAGAILDVNLQGQMVFPLADE